MLAATKRWLHTTWGVSVQDDWLSACIDWIRNEEGADLSGARVQELVYEQWLHADLKDTAVGGCIPPSVVQERAFVMNGRFIVQVDSVLDVSVPAYAQLQTLKGQELDTAEEHDHERKEPKPTRLILLTLSDGFSVVQGMEHKPILQLSTQTAPGTKLVLQGTIESRLGVLLLRSDQVTVLGGVVEELSEKNEQKKLLSRILNNEGLAASEGLGSLPVARSHNGSSDRAITQAVAASRQTNVDQDVIEIPDSPVDLRTHVVPSPVPSIDLGEFENFEEEDIFNDEEASIEPALPSEMETEHDVGLEWEQDFKEPDFELDRDFEAIYDQEVDFDNETHVEQGPDLPGKQGLDLPGKQNLQICLEKERIIKANTAVQPSSKGVTGQGNICSKHCSSSTGQSKGHIAPPIVGKGPALLTLKDLQSPRIWDTCPVVKVKAKFASVVEKLQCDHGLWGITVLIVDESRSELKVHLSNKVLETLIGFTAVEFKEHIEPNRSKPSVKAQGKKGFQRCQSALAQLHCFMEITRCSPESLPSVERLLDS